MINKIKIQNFKSIKKQGIEFKKINLLVGSNGSGKSNLLSLFTFLQKLIDQQLEDYIFHNGGIETFLFSSKKISEKLFVRLEIGTIRDESFSYEFAISSNREFFKIDKERFKFDNENIGWVSDIERFQTIQENMNYSKESLLKSKLNQTYNGPYIQNYINNFKVYHFDNTNINTLIRGIQDIDENYYLTMDGNNIASYLKYLRDSCNENYLRIIENIKLVYPLFHDFILDESPRGKIMLRWKERGNDNIYKARQMSDGTLRFVCLATLLLQPMSNLIKSNDVIIIDEPELGLHPFAIHILSELIKKASLEKQIIIATQSVNLINEFTPEDILITERNEDGETIFKRKTSDELKEWLEDYSLGQLWESNLLGGRP